MGHRRPGAFSLENNHFYDLIDVNNTLKFALQPCTPKPCKHVIHDYSALCAQLKLFSKSDLIQKYTLWPKDVFLNILHSSTNVHYQKSACLELVKEFKSKTELFASPKTDRLRRATVVHHQWDQIWRNFAILAKSSKSWIILWGFVWEYVRPTLANFVCHWASFHRYKWPNVEK